MESTYVPYLAYGIAGIVTSCFIVYLANPTRLNLDFIPTVGPSGRLTSYIGAFRFLSNGQHMVEEGYRKYPSSMFRVPFMDKWMVVLNGSKLVDDIRRAKDEELSIFEAVVDGFQLKYNLSLDVGHDPYHVITLQQPLTRNLDACFSDVHDEIVHSFQDVISLSHNDWTTVVCFEKLIEIVCRVSHRLFVGLPLCRDRDYLDLNKQFVIDAFKSAFLINLFPNFLKPIVGPIFSPFNKTMPRIGKHLYPIIEERLKNDKMQGKDHAHRPNDLITWLIDESPEGSTPYDIALRIQVVNFAAIHSASSSFTHALYHLAANPGYAQPLREEIEAVVQTDGWTKTSMTKLRKVDSFLRESLRFNGIGCLTIFRKIVKPTGFTFSNGVTLPYGTFIAVPSYAMHHDEAIYPNANIFDGFRFANMYNTEDGPGTKYQMTTTNLDYLSWGYGRHACPGRFFAVTELKAMFAHVIMMYDVKFKEEGAFPPNQWFAENCIPNRTAEVMFRKRK